MPGGGFGVLRAGGGLMAGAVAAARVWALLAVLAVAGCAALSPKTPEEVVRTRAQERWNALLAGEWARAYALMAPSYRAVVEEKRFAGQFGGGVSWVAAEVVSVACEKDRCTVQMKVTFRPVSGARRGSTLSSHFDETWIREEEQWWMFQKI